MAGLVRTSALSLFDLAYLSPVRAGSFHEFLDIIRLLTNPTNPEDQAFHCVIPSMPGYAFSSPPKTSHWKMSDTARVYDKLMTGLSYKKYAAQGGDWGSITARCLGALYPENCTGMSSRPRTLSPGARAHS